MTGRQARSTSTDKFPLFLHNLWWPDYGPYGNTKYQRKSVEDVEPEFDCSKFTIVTLGEFCDTENTSDLDISLTSKCGDLWRTDKDSSRGP